MMYGGKDERSGQAFPAKFLQGVEDRVEPWLEGLDDTVVPVFRALRDQAPGVVGEEVVVVLQAEPLGIPPDMVRRQPHRDVLSGHLRLAGLEHQVEAAGPYRLSHPCGSTRGVEELAPVQVEPQVPVRHLPHVALTHRGEKCHGGNGVWRKMVELHPIVVAERPHKMTRRGA